VRVEGRDGRPSPAAGKSRKIVGSDERTTGGITRDGADDDALINHQLTFIARIVRLGRDLVVEITIVTSVVVVSLLAFSFTVGADVFTSSVVRRPTVVSSTVVTGVVINVVFESITIAVLFTKNTGVVNVVVRVVSLVEAAVVQGTVPSTARGRGSNTLLAIRTRAT
jgi:hypothetical protein